MMLRARPVFVHFAAPLAVAAFMALFVWLSSPAFASGTLQFEAKPYSEAVFSTRVHLAEVLLTGELDAKWHTEYALSESGPWTAAGSGETLEFGGKFVSSEVTFLGTAPTSSTVASASVLHHLEPEKTYFARFHAENTAGETASKTFEFKTLPSTAPEVSLPGYDAGPSEAFQVGSTSPTTGRARAEIDANGAQTEYDFEYAPAEEGHAPAQGSATWKPFTAGAGGTITVAEDYADVEATLSGLSPETTYYTRLRTSNSHGTVIVTKSVESPSEDGSLTTPTARPISVSVDQIRNITATFAHLVAKFVPQRLAAHWRFEYAELETGPWNPVPGSEGALSQAQAESLSEERQVSVDSSLAGLHPGIVYYVRFVAENSYGASTSPVESFSTAGAPSLSTFAVHGLHGEALRVMGAVNPNSVPTSGEQVVSVEGATGGTFTLSFKGETTGPLAFNASSDEVEKALDALPVTNGKVIVTGLGGGPYTAYFYGSNGEVAQPTISGDGSELSPAGSGKVNVTVVFAGGEGYDTHYHFEYVSQKQFEAPGGEGGFAKASPTHEEDLGSGDRVKYVGVDLPPLAAGETYRFRLVAGNNSPGDPVVDGEEQSLTVPAPVAPEGASGSCPNEAVRSGLSGRLPDCRAYEQVTPADKEGAEEIFSYGATFGKEGAFPSEDGNHLEYGAASVKWGSAASDGQSPYFFTRETGGWSLTAGAAQPAAGVSRYTPGLFGPALEAFAFESSWSVAPSHSSTRTEFEVGSAGGPYTTVASVPVAQARPGWVASSKDFSTLVLEVPDHVLLGHSTHTTQGNDLYEYSSGQLRQINVTGSSPGVTIGSCGARIAAGYSGLGAGNATEFAGSVYTASAHAVSSDGSRVFFEAIPSSNCSEAKHVFMRVNGSSENAQTVDLGAYRFVAATPDGSRVLLEKSSGENTGLYLYSTETGKAEYLPSSGIAARHAFSTVDLTVSRDLSAVYVHRPTGTVNSEQDLYRYDVTARRLMFVTHFTRDSGGGFNYYSTSPDGRYLYFLAETVAGLPGGKESSQAYRYDSMQELLQCISCASAYNPAPRLSALYADQAGKVNASESNAMSASENGDYIFFDTPAGLLPADAEKEIAPEGTASKGREHTSDDYSLSSDVYEWRRYGLNGCMHPQGCLALITSGGGGGFMNVLLGTTPSGRDVFFATNDSLVAADNDTASDIYDARIGGGFPEGVSPVACEGDSCAAPFSAPNDPTPSTATFQGVGNVLVTGLAEAKTKRRTRHGVCAAHAKRRCRGRHAKGRHRRARRARRAQASGSTGR